MIRCCRDCKEREIGCHSTCEIYLQEKTKHDKERIIRNKESKEIYMTKCYIDKSIKRMKRGKRK